MTAITIDRSVLVQALEALEWISDVYVGDDDDAGECASCHQRSYKPHAPDCKKNNAITALRAAFAQPSARQVSPAAFAEIVKSREEIVGVPVYWAQWPTEVQK